MDDLISLQHIKYYTRETENSFFLEGKSLFALSTPLEPGIEAWSESALKSKQDNKSTQTAGIWAR